tara:strand:+ start:354 stop:800 length:447 start_codon:yes stop_codon:yes gene_type:complete
MREIKFRGLLQSGVFIFGSYVTDGKDYHAILRENPNDSSEMLNTPVIPESVGQFTGLQDKNGVDIYVGDIVTSHQFLFDGNEVESIIFGVIASNDFGWTLGRIKNKFYEDYTGYEPSEGETNLGDFYGLHEESFEVIGNIHQNPELIK